MQKMLYLHRKITEKMIPNQISFFEKEKEKLKPITYSCGKCGKERKWPGTCHTCLSGIENWLKNFYKKNDRNTNTKTEK